MIAVREGSGAAVEIVSMLFPLFIGIAVHVESTNNHRKCPHPVLPPPPQGKGRTFELASDNAAPKFWKQWPANFLDASVLT
jgi:hypothetical protein